MRILSATLWLALVIFTFPALACPNISGAFVFFKGSSWEYTQQVKQVGCETINAGEPLTGFNDQVSLNRQKEIVSDGLATYKAYVLYASTIVQEARATRNDPPGAVHGQRCFYSLNGDKNLVRHCQGISIDEKVLWDLTEIGLRK